LGSTVVFGKALTPTARVDEVRAMNLDDGVIAITGASAGLGATVAREDVKRGSHTALLSRVHGIVAPAQGGS